MKFEEEIKKIDDMVGDDVYDGIVEARRRALVVCCEKWYVRKELHWKQMSLSRHAMDIDKNTRYFHNLASARRRNNRIDALLINGRSIRNQARIKIATWDFYKNLYRQEESPLVGFRDGLVEMIGEEDASALEVQPTLEELLADVNLTWVALALKFTGAKEIKDLRPINMVNCVYKVVSKMLVRRMQAIMPSLVGETQSAFVKGRKIHDGALIACETIQWIKLRKKEAVIIKLASRKHITESSGALCTLCCKRWVLDEDGGVGLCSV
ncbi:uncharacterized protein LOC107633818 [Arachis ipaensis]|uniref:uncharacterized protein LOC107633818 n=1 Tax=Arachis ipaensis TaxID=130454 RepID=UPI0007AFBA20|nr:uncharacterized protein LOC107633818 [Arachis ipaensis]XP_025640805.1 uncharacterized protein LOC112735487 [Arachis hypogaea]